METINYISLGIVLTILVSGIVLHFYYKVEDLTRENKRLEHVCTKYRNETFRHLETIFELRAEIEQLKKRRKPKATS
jgi:hypothetical protein